MSNVKLTHYESSLCERPKNMNGNNLKMPSETDWARIDAQTDEEIDTSDIPPLADQFFAQAKWRLPHKKEEVTLKVDATVLEWYRAQGEEFQQRIEAVLRIYADAHRITN